VGGWLATTKDRTALCRPVRIDCDTVGRNIERVMVTGPDSSRLGTCSWPATTRSAGARAPDVTLVSNHGTGNFVWGEEGGEGGGSDTLDC